MVWTALGALVPGVGLIRAGRRLAGFTALVIFVAAVAGLAALALDRRTALGLVFSPDVMAGLSAALAVVAVLWVALISATHLALRPTWVSGFQRVCGALFVGLLSFVVAAPLAVAARYSYDQSHLITQVFVREVTSVTAPSITPGPKTDPWANHPRLNVLLLGSDAAPDRPGARTDSVMVASIDTKTGDTVLVSLPRNTARMPFPKDSPLYKYYPNGFYDGKNPDDLEYMLTAMWDNVPDTVPNTILGKTDNFAADVVKLSVGEALGLKLDYYVYVDMQGFTDLIDALGGIRVNVNTRIPIAGNSEGKRPTGYIDPGPNKLLDGYNAMWYARSRSASDDYERMGRQRCVIQAVVQQADPAAFLTRYEAIARTGGKIVKTDVPQNMLPMMVELALRVKGGSLRGLQFQHDVDGFLSTNPNFAMMRARVATAISESTGQPVATPTPSASASRSATPSATRSTTPTKSASAAVTPTPVATPSTTSQNVSDACAYDPSLASPSPAPTKR